MRTLLSFTLFLALATALTTWIVDKGNPQSADDTGTATTEGSTPDTNSSGPVQQFVSQIIMSVLPAEHTNEAQHNEIMGIRNDLRNNITMFSNNLARQIKFDKTGVLSALVFVYLGLLVLMQLEDTFNDLWAVRRSRVWYSQLLKFSPGLVFGPGCIILAFALTNGVHFEAISDALQGMGPAVNTLVPLFFAMAGLTFLYKLIPNTRVPWSAALWGGLVAGRSGIGPITLCDSIDYPCKIAGEVRNLDFGRFMNTKEARRLARFSHLAIAAAHMAVEDADLDLGQEDLEMFGVLLGNGSGGLPETQEVCHDMFSKGGMKINPFFIPMMLPNMASANVARVVGAKGYNSTVTTACAASNQSIGEATEAIRRGSVDVVLTGGTEAGISDVGLAGFCILKAYHLNFLTVINI